MKKIAIETLFAECKQLIKQLEQTGSPPLLDLRELHFCLKKSDLSTEKNPEAMKLVAGIKYGLEDRYPGARLDEGVDMAQEPADSGAIDIAIELLELASSKALKSCLFHLIRTAFDKREGIEIPKYHYKDTTARDRSIYTKREFITFAGNALNNLRMSEEEEAAQQQHQSNSQSTGGGGGGGGGGGDGTQNNLKFPGNQSESILLELQKTGGLIDSNDYSRIAKQSNNALNSKAVEKIVGRQKKSARQSLFDRLKQDRPNDREDKELINWCTAVKDELVADLLSSENPQKLLADTVNQKTVLHKIFTTHRRFHLPGKQTKTMAYLKNRLSTNSAGLFAAAKSPPVPDDNPEIGAVANDKKTGEKRELEMSKSSVAEAPRSG